jgi:Sec-independent protein translocase protein TatA
MPGMGVSGILVLSLTVAMVVGSRRFPRTARPAGGATGGFLSGPAPDDARTPERVGLTLRHIQLRELQRTPEPWDHLPLEVAHLPEDGDAGEVEVEDAAEVEGDGAAITLVTEEDAAVEEDGAVTEPEYGPVRVDLEGASAVAA